MISLNNCFSCVCWMDTSFIGQKLYTFVVMLKYFLGSLLVKKKKKLCSLLVKNEIKIFCIFLLVVFISGHILFNIR